MLFTAIPFLFLLLSTSDNSTLLDIQINQQFDLNYQQTAILKTDDLRIRFSSLLQDSRCPKGEQCITQGDASIELQLSEPEQQPEAFQLNTESAPGEVEYAKYKIKLISLSPYPGAGEGTDPDRYTATLLVTKP